MTASTHRYLITGANGQDGTHMVQKLVADGIEAHGMCRTLEGVAALEAEISGAIGHVGDLRDDAALADLVASVQPTHIVNLAGNTSVAHSWDAPAEAANVLGVGPVRLLEAAWRSSEEGRPVRMLQASSAEIFGDATDVPQTEDTPKHPVTPYGAAKAFAHEMAAVYRARGLYVSTAILYNHESPRRPESFVARKIAVAAARIAAGLQDQLVLGNIDAERDWGYAPDYVDAMLLILRQQASGDYVVATGVSHSVRQFVALAFEFVGIDDWSRHVVIDPNLYRPADPRSLVGDPARLRSIGWEPSVDFVELVQTMVAAEQAAIAARP